MDGGSFADLFKAFFLKGGFKGIVDSCMFLLPVHTFWQVFGVQVLQTHQSTDIPLNTRTFCCYQRSRKQAKPAGGAEKSDTADTREEHRERAVILQLALRFQCYVVALRLVEMKRPGKNMKHLTKQSAANESVKESLRNIFFSTWTQAKLQCLYFLLS